jgi:transposase InsO family protein
MGMHHIFDFVIKHEGRIFRPWLTMLIDMRSRKITGWHIDAVPNTFIELFSKRQATYVGSNTTDCPRSCSGEG